jgi:hypothetical protein
MCEESELVCFKVLSRHCSWNREEITKHLRIVDFRYRFERNTWQINCKSGHLGLEMFLAVVITNKVS